MCSQFSSLINPEATPEEVAATPMLSPNLGKYERFICPECKKQFDPPRKPVPFGVVYCKHCHYAEDYDGGLV